MRGRSKLVTWSPSVTLVPTSSCFNHCGYCGFRQTPHPQDPLADALTEPEAQASLERRPGAREVLLLSGEVAPQAPQRRPWLALLLRLSRLALANGRLPHTNAGPLSLHEMAALGRLNPSMGLMLEGLGPVWQRWHRQAPSKLLELRLLQLEQAGRLGIPFTTGLLLGVGESTRDRRQALELIALLQATWGHVQEVILQPYRPPGLSPAELDPARCDELLDLIGEARHILPPEVHLQLPPNLWPRQRLLEALEAGIDDLGGIDGDRDVINPAYAQPSPQALARQLAAAGWELRPRLCVHRPWLDRLPSPLRQRAQAMAQQLDRPG
ncbi:7,8-didemethyl-8-hydroxy-5-deazariboflavin synthase subunit CofG [Cyanobium sp. NS01]|uniref:7,8-didemethyl-8-hydroxy-5-deazariboflavin synthase subunit CofG n=1 Tax=Cyanobium sp. NS01 TaxID=261284 RepID=UPI00164545AF|nr:7,8-didemethyl-8-hydroxy-5-deazariboflavin synthase subunit CofG [Cyanobium sp. NS01]